MRLQDWHFLYKNKHLYLGITLFECVAQKCYTSQVHPSPRNSTWSTRPFFLVGGWGLGTRLLNIVRLHKSSPPQPKKFDLVHQTILPCERVGSGDETTQHCQVTLVAKVHPNPRNSTWSTRPFFLVRGWGLGTRLTHQ